MVQQLAIVCCSAGSPSIKLWQHRAQLFLDVVISNSRLSEEILLTVSAYPYTSRPAVLHLLYSVEKTRKLYLRLYSNPPLIEKTHQKTLDDRYLQQRQRDVQCGQIR